jgi:hypothetical protein
MKQAIKPVYYCDFCKKKGLSKHAMVKHEKFCSGNPENNVACQGCVNLEETVVAYGYSYDTLGEGYGVIPDGGYQERKTTGFRCKKLNKDFYPLKCVRKGLVDKYPETFEGKELFPKECFDWEYGMV